MVYVIKMFSEDGPSMRIELTRERGERMFNSLVKGIEENDGLVKIHLLEWDTVTQDYEVIREFKN